MLDPLVMTQQYLKLKRLQQRKKKQVDTRASKGRKLRYHTHDKLVGFMTAQPQKYPEFDSPMARALFASLLGTKRTLFWRYLSDLKILDSFCRSRIQINKQAVCNFITRYRIQVQRGLMASRVQTCVYYSDVRFTFRMLLGESDV